MEQDKKNITSQEKDRVNELAEKLKRKGTVTSDELLEIIDSSGLSDEETEKLYAWSRDMYISPQGLENTSLQGDEFYLVTRKGEAEVAYAYNKKFFEYKGKYNLS